MHTLLNHIGQYGGRLQAWANILATSRLGHTAINSLPGFVQREQLMILITGTHG